MTAVARDDDLIQELVLSGSLSSEGLRQLEAACKRTSLHPVVCLRELDLVPERELLVARSKILGIPYVAVEELSPEPDIVTLIPESYSRENQLIALEKQGAKLVVAAADPANLKLGDELAAMLRSRPTLVLASSGEIARKLAEYHDHYKAAAVERLLGSVQDQGRVLAQRMGLSFSDLGGSAGEGSAALRTLNLLLLQGLLKRASDIHIEPRARHLWVRYRIDGVLHEAQRLQLSLAPALINRIKVLATLDIAERRLPQDGSFHINVDGREIDFRVATTPTVRGEKAVLRILDQQATLLGLENLGLSENIYEQLRKVIRRPNGIVLMVGPTGSGKTTTLYAGLQTLNTGHRNITTIEDPVEYQIDGITQIQVHEDIGLGFSEILRSVLRQDPDVILLGEIRDLDTTVNAIRASLTGHLVFATLHTNDAVSAVSRLIDMGAEPYLIAPSLRAVVSQRLVRTLCPHCKSPGDPDPELMAMLPESERTLTAVWHARGCRLCFSTGYRGRVPIAEILVVNEELRRLIVDRAHPSRIQEAAVANGMRPIFNDGLSKVAQGVTTLEEVLATLETSP
jgi:type IV pilus assembly protein PilB